MTRSSVYLASHREYFKAQGNLTQRYKIMVTLSILEVIKWEYFSDHKILYPSLLNERNALVQFIEISYVMFCCICLSILFCNVYCINNEDVKKKAVITASDIAEQFLTIFINDENESKRIKDLKDKLSRIDSYILDRAKYEELILNTIKSSDLNETNFYNALSEQDNFRLHNHTKNLYQSMKEKINRDDIFNIISKQEKYVNISARRMMSDNEKDDRKLEEKVDKYLAEVPNDNHKFNRTLTNSYYWDPTAELKELQEQRLYKNRRIFRGERTTVTYYPFVVSVHVMGRFWCGGSIFWKDLIITSAACLQLIYNNRFYRENPKLLHVRVGSNHSLVGGEKIEALEVYFHPSYNPKTLEHNIALIRLQRQIKTSHHRVPKFIQISNTEGVPFTAQVLLLGWGAQKQTIPYEPTFLQRKILPIYPSIHCKEIYGEKFNQKNMFCAGTLTTGEGACNHDAGGPAVLNGKLVGIISYGPALCGFPDSPTVMTTIGVYSDWIETVNESLPAYYRAKARTTTTESELELYERAKLQEEKEREIRYRFSLINSTTTTTRANYDEQTIRDMIAPYAWQPTQGIVFGATKQLCKISKINTKQFMRLRNNVKKKLKAINHKSDRHIPEFKDPNHEVSPGIDTLRIIQEYEVPSPHKPFRPEGSLSLGHEFPKSDLRQYTTMEQVPPPFYDGKSMEDNKEATTDDVIRKEDIDKIIKENVLVMSDNKQLSKDDEQLIKDIRDMMLQNGVVLTDENINDGTVTNNVYLRAFAEEMTTTKASEEKELEKDIQYPI